MSASLVGSEMCIRDRCTAPGHILNYVPVQPSLEDARLTQCYCWDGRTPVSYTHLTLPTICSV
eukprot:7761162-Alexandrium_andersonii.AAC.1